MRITHVNHRKPATRVTQLMKPRSRATIPPTRYAVGATRPVGVHIFIFIVGFTGQGYCATWLSLVERVSRQSVFVVPLSRSMR